MDGHAEELFQSAIVIIVERRLMPYFISPLAEHPSSYVGLAPRRVFLHPFCL